jgi:soluble lytic murein transglycosylase
LAAVPRILRGDEHWALGLFPEAKAEFENLRSELQSDALGTYRLMQHLLDLGLYQPAIFASRNILDLAGMDNATSLSAPIYFNHIRFGTYFRELIFPEAEAYDLDPALVLALIRQESLFEGFITSYAAARGLMQVIPSTGEEIAGQLGWPIGYNQDDLYRPLVSVRFGVYYLARQRDYLDGDIYAALAAYNGGPGNSLNWQTAADGDLDMFVEIVRFDQTRRYIRSIFEVYKIYQSLYPEEAFSEN